MRAVADQLITRAKLTPGIGPFGTIAWAPYGRRVYSRTSDNGSDIWIMAADGMHAQQLTANAGSNGEPHVTADGRYVVFGSDRNGREQIWRMDVDGDHATLLSAGSGWQPRGSPDSRWVIYEDNAGGHWGLWKVPIEGGTPRRSPSSRLSGAISPDGRLLAYEWYNAAAKKYQLLVKSFEGRPVIKAFDAAESGFYGILDWTRDGSGLTYLNNESIVLQPLSGGPPRRLVESSDDIFGFIFSPDGHQVAYTSGHNTTDLVMIHSAPAEQKVCAGV